MAVSIRALIPKNRFGKVKAAAARHRVVKLPEPYQKFFGEWKDEEGTPVHWIPRTENWYRDPKSGRVVPVRDRPIPVTYPDQMHYGLWGGEGVVEGLVKKGRYRSPVPRFWVPNLKKSVVYSEILDIYFAVNVTERALKLIDKHNGLDPYLLENPAYELKSLLALKLKRKLLLALVTGDFRHDDPDKHAYLLEKYQQYIRPLEEAEWYGLSVIEAEAKHLQILEKEKEKAIFPLKHQYRFELIQKLKEIPEEDMPSEDSKSWISKLNPFTKPETPVEKTV